METEDSHRCSGCRRDCYLHLEVPEGETSVQALVEGTIGFLASESVVTERFNEQTDVFAFGATLIASFDWEGAS
ncbi:hypothetical protein HID58_007937 [Brassica napus]|uniref:Uncharacterized protein n=1 Tax=Brassica napus TaxID=3708 RepID=A0ABQ7XKA3_BRANA|nr:hypothetical protein HID58_007937 [Brassica napus]